MKALSRFMQKHTMVFPFVLMLVLTLIEFNASLFVSRTFHYFVPHAANETFQSFAIEASDTGEPVDALVRVSGIKEHREDTEILLTSVETGKSIVRLVTVFQNEKGEERIVEKTDILTISKAKVVFLGKGLADFTGYPFFFYMVAVYAGLMILYINWQRKKLKEKCNYSPRSIIHWGGLLFFGSSFIVNGIASLTALIGYKKLGTYMMLVITNHLMLIMIGMVLPFLLLFAIFLIISNFALIRHEGKRFANTLGIIAGSGIFFGDVFVMILYRANYLWGKDHAGIAIAYAVSAAFLLIFQLLLTGAVICGFSAARRQPAFDKDYIIIPGCKIRKDGTLYPLIRGRVDRALKFFHAQEEATGKKAVFVPSGGQGSDEVISEGEAMARYLKEQGIPEELILPETESKTTLENMRFSGELIKQQNKDAKVAFSTTNYHVFRSGLFTVEAGLKAEGMGADTVWYFWPNAFLREVAGLFVVQSKMHLLLAIIIALLAGLSGYTNYLVF